MHKSDNRKLNADSLQQFDGTKMRCNKVIILAGINPLFAKFKSWEDKLIYVWDLVYSISGSIRKNCPIVIMVVLS